MRLYTWIGSVLILAGAGCASSQAEQVRDARMAQIDDQTVAKTRAIEERQEARQDAIEHRHDLAAKRVEAENRPDERAAEEQLGVASDRAAYQSKAEGEVETLDVRLHAAEQKLATLGSAAPVRFEAELKTLEHAQRQLAKDLRELPNTPIRAWEATKDTLDERISSLGSRIKDLTSEIEDT